MTPQELMLKWQVLAGWAVKNCRMAVRILGADEVYSVANLAIARAAHGFDAALGSFLSYACNIIRRSLRDQIHREGVIRNKSGSKYGYKLITVYHVSQLDAADRDAFVAALVTVPAQTDNCNRRLDVLQALARLPERWRHVLVQYVVHGRSMQDIAEEMGFRRQRGHQLYDKAVKLMRQLLTPAEAA